MSNWNTYTSPNIGLLFYKRIYKEDEIKRKLRKEGNELIINIPNDEKTSPFDEFYKDLYEQTAKDWPQIANAAATETFHLVTTYPGLLVGSGYQHDTKAKGDFKIGFFFDHTTGQPIIPGSSVKGVLHSLFELDVEGTNASNRRNVTGAKSLEAIRFICSEIIEKGKLKADEKLKWENIKNTFTIPLLKELKKNIFGDKDNEGTDIFFDAVIHLNRTGKGNKIIDRDFLTPHKNNPLKNPIPLQFLKVLPKVVFEFRFKLKDFDEFWTKEKKKLFFQYILLTLGIGAKTNVGYGQFDIAPPSGESQIKTFEELGREATTVGEITRVSPITVRLVNISNYDRLHTVAKIGGIVPKEGDKYLVKVRKERNQIIQIQFVIPLMKIE